MARPRVLIGLVVIPILFSACQRLTAGRRISLAPSRASATVRENAPTTMNCPVTKAILDEPPKDPNADLSGVGDWYVNAERTIWVRSQHWRVGSEGNKVIWIRPAGTELTIIGRRLDGWAPLLGVDMPCCYPTGFQVTGLYFPTDGCWEITAMAGNSKLRFVTEVQREKAPAQDSENSKRPESP